ncbi:thymidylate synthase [Klebsiella variicola]|uniref:thymidylate synthase n=1 Tax=Klebsiella variicola TaxID=244366 RepID=UPI0013EF20FE|nr:thymidylate synthase [Klebsiella variicola]QJO97100.1 thymidylate synthase [Klebsiella pneumoniae]HDQ5286056.1 thymidylate synthase [Raoultella ornithinolytica]HDT0615552.1 thymidylate synthase [Klebsiella michiganensis]HDX8813979.1 thymidylate synthase [Klebsiella oxytoca]HCC6220402.1 thymidylate synthase [Klebsiella pneumoniae]
MSFLLNREFSNGQLASSSYGRVIQTVVDTGVPSEDRTGTGTLGVSYVPSYYMLTGGAVPLISSKQVNLKPLLVELEWYLRGSGNIGFLKEHGVKIWDAWADDNGDLGPVYGKQWRRWEDTRIVPYSEYLLKTDVFLDRGYRVEGYIGLNEDRVVITREIDQLQRMVDQLRNNPTDRRILLNAWNVGELEDMKLPPCHFVFSVWSRELDFQTRLSMATDIGIQHNRHGYESIYTQMLCLIEQRGSISEPMLDELGIPKRILNSCLVQRSVDTFLGMPFNISGYGILTQFIAKITGHMAGAFVHFGFDVHIYNNHMEQVEELLAREHPEPSDPIVVFPHEWEELDDFKWDGVQIFGYEPLPWIKAPVAV